MFPSINEQQMKDAKDAFLPKTRDYPANTKFKLEKDPYIRIESGKCSCPTYNAFSKPNSIEIEPNWIYNAPILEIDEDAYNPDPNHPLAPKPLKRYSGSDHEEHSSCYVPVFCAIYPSKKCLDILIYGRRSTFLNEMIDRLLGVHFNNDDESNFVRMDFSDLQYLNVEDIKDAYGREYVGCLKMKIRARDKADADSMCMETIHTIDQFLEEVDSCFQPCHAALKHRWNIEKFDSWVCRGHTCSA